MAANGPLVVSDARADPLLQDNEAITDLDVIAYAGWPLRLSDGEAVGAFCVADRTVRRWTDQELEAVRDFAAVASADLSAALSTAELIEKQRHTAAELAKEHELAVVRQAYLDGLVENLDVGVAASDLEGRLVLLNRALRNVIDAEADPTLTPADWTRRFHATRADGRPFELGELPIMRVLRGEFPVNDEMMINTPDGHRRLMNIDATPIEAPDGKRLGAVTIVRDITEARRAARLRQCETALAWILAGVPDTATAAHLVLLTVVESLGWCHAEFWLADEVIGRLRPVATWDDSDRHLNIYVPETLRRDQGIAGTVWSRGSPWWLADGDAELKMRSKDGQPCGLRTALGVPVRAGGGTAGALCLFTSTVEEPDDNLVALLSGIAAQLGEHLQRSRAVQLTHALERSKDEYVALVGHELRTPLTSIASYTSLLLDSPDGTPFAELRPLLETVDRNIGQLRGIIDDLLDLAALDTGHIVLQRRRVDLCQTVQDAITDLAEFATQHQVVITARLPERLYVDGDPDRLRQVVNHLIGNAVKYCVDGGNVTVVLEDRAGAAELTVTDTGIGIPTEERDLVFERFYRSSRARERGIPGTGLGLARTRLLVRLHHGSIAISSNDEGTTARVRLPRPAPPPPDLPTDVHRG